MLKMNTYGECNTEQLIPLLVLVSKLGTSLTSLSTSIQTPTVSYINTTKLDISKCSCIRKLKKHFPESSKLYQYLLNLKTLYNWSTSICKIPNTNRVMWITTLSKQPSAEKKGDLQQMLRHLKEDNRAFFKELIN